MKAFKQLPYSIKQVRRLSKLYNKAFHTKVFTLFASSQSEVYTFAQLHSPHYGFCMVFNKNFEGPYFLDDRGVEKVRNWVIQQARNKPQKIFKIHALWEKAWQKYLKLSYSLLKVDLSAFSDRRLYRHFESFYGHYLKAGGLAYICDSFMSSGENDWLEVLLYKELKKYKITREFPEKIRLLTYPSTSSYALKEEMEAEQLAAEMQKRFGSRLPKFQTLKNQGGNIVKKIKNHAYKYYWIKNNYYHAENFSPEKAYKKIGKLIKDANRKKQSITHSLKAKRQQLKKFRSKQIILLKSLRLPPQLKNILKIAQIFAHWKDTRKSGVYIGMHYFNRFLQEVSKRKKISKLDLSFLVFPEIKAFFLENKNFDSEIKNRKAQIFYTVTPKGYFIASGKQANPLFEILSGSKSTSTNQIRGVCACPGYAQGKVRVVKTLGHMKQFKNGEILVANQTTPEFVPIMKKAAAIVTEQGGITSHAAVVSRELGIPCVIGTKIATEVLKDGDVVEVNADTGMIKVIK